MVCVRDWGWDDLDWGARRGLHPNPDSGNFPHCPVTPMVGVTGCPVSGFQRSLSASRPSTVDPECRWDGRDSRVVTRSAPDTSYVPSLGRFVTHQSLTSKLPSNDGRLVLSKP